MRLIDADRLLEERRLHLYYHLPNGDTAIPIIDIKHAPTVNNGEWIPVSELLPKKPNIGTHRGWYIVALESGCVMSLGFDYETEEWFHTGSPVSHWMPLPAPPKD
jgi:hypothetical protein